MKKNAAKTNYWKYINNDYFNTFAFGSMLLFLISLDYGISLANATLSYITMFVIIKQNSWRKECLFTKRKMAIFKQKGFEKTGNRYRGTIKSFRVEFTCVDYRGLEIYVYHKTITSEKFDSISKIHKNKKWMCLQKYYSHNNLFYSTTSLDYSIFIPRPKRILKECDDFVEKLIELKFQPAN
jgi:hypothetical protein